MNKERKWAVFADRFKHFGPTIAIYFFNMALILIVFILYGLQTEPFLYVFAVSFLCLVIIFVISFIKEYKKAQLRRNKLEAVMSEWNDLPPAESLSEEDYREMIEVLGREMEKAVLAFSDERRETQDFYTAWVHQVKTPIAVMKLALGGSGDPDKRALTEELFRIEQYTDMVLAYQRLGSSTNDLVIREYPLDELIREVIRKFAPQFIGKKLKLQYEGTDVNFVTDKKWFVCILDQLVSNAIKYTSGGSISITVENAAVCIADTGIGIASEDLPRIFEKGYTGANGRLNEKSSGLGLYLCGKAAKLLNTPIRVESEPGKGSRFYIDISAGLKEDDGLFYVK